MFSIDRNRRTQLRLHLVGELSTRDEAACLPARDRDPPKPDEHDGCDCSSIVLVNQWCFASFAILMHPVMRSLWLLSLQVRAMSRRDDGQCQCRGQVEAGRQYTTCLPRNAHSPRLLALRPEEIKEEGCTKDKSDEDTGEDVIRACTDIIVIVYLDSVLRNRLDLSLHLDVICEATKH